VSGISPGWVVAGVIIGIVIAVIMIAGAVSPKGQAKAARTCTKHWIASSVIPGGPDQMKWRYGAHRTRGNACDGTEHERTSGW
jgi:hypothetical protein